MRPRHLYIIATLLFVALAVGCGESPTPQSGAPVAPSPTPPVEAAKGGATASTTAPSATEGPAASQITTRAATTTTTTMPTPLADLPQVVPAGPSATPETAPPAPVANATLIFFDAPN